MSVEEIAAAQDSNQVNLRVSIVGIGGAGNNFIDHGIRHGINPTDCVAVNDDGSRLSKCEATNKVYIGTSMEDEVLAGQGNLLVQSSAHRITPFTHNSDFTIIVAGLGGNTGTIAAPMVAQYNRTLVKPVISIIAIPYIHERERRFVALRGLKRMIESCDSTIVIDNSMQGDKLDSTDRLADTNASIALQAMSQIVESGDRKLSQRLLDNLSTGNITIMATAIWTHRDTLQSVVCRALNSPTAKMPLLQTKGAILVFTGRDQMTITQAAKAYQAIVSVVGHDVKFLPVNLNDQGPPRICIFLSGFSYESTIGSFVEYIQDLYDLEYGEDQARVRLNLESSLVNMEEV